MQFTTLAELDCLVHKLISFCRWFAWSFEACLGCQTSVAIQETQKVMYYILQLDQDMHFVAADLIVKYIFTQYIFVKNVLDM